MDLFLDYPLTSLFVLLAVVWVATKAVRKSGLVQFGSAAVTCPQCGTTLPGVARFCRHCGQAVQQ